MRHIEFRLTSPDHTSELLDTSTQSDWARARNTQHDTVLLARSNAIARYQPKQQTRLLPPGGGPSGVESHPEPGHLMYVRQGQRDNEALDGVTDDGLEKVRSHFTDEEVADLTAEVVTIHAWTRFVTAFHDVPAVTASGAFQDEGMDESV